MIQKFISLFGYGTSGTAVILGIYSEFVERLNIYCVLGVTLVSFAYWLLSIRNKTKDAKIKDLQISKLEKELEEFAAKSEYYRKKK